MSSNINPNNIDSTYPVAGQDNDSQGFRDNFTNIKNNFTYSKSEIEDLQSKVLLKSALTGGTLDNNMAGATITSVTLLDSRETTVDKGSVSGTVTLNHNEGHYQLLTSSGSVSLALANWPTSGKAGRIRLEANVTSTSHTLTLPAAVSVGNVNLQGASSNVITFAATGRYYYDFTSTDAGTTVFVNEVSRPRSTFSNPLFLTGSEDLANAGAASLTKTTSYFTTGAAETGTLAAGTDGQIKVLAMAGDSGDMVITVSNAGWKSSGTGTITFNDIGDAVTMLYTNSKWYCIGNNGATFA
jgi:hypothetical protein